MRDASLRSFIAGKAGHRFKLMIIQGDCIEVMAGMPENSVDAIVTDPPYGLEFMGKEWDRLDSDRIGFHKGKERDLIGECDGTPFRRHTGTPSFHGQLRGYWCKTCERYKGGNPSINCTCETPNLIAISRGNQQQEFHCQWATQALRVLKPGGYLLAFGGTRTQHRLVCGLEDAGFEIRDTVLWLFGQGFPKNLDISKQIDKMAGTYVPGETSPNSRGSGPSPSGCYGEGVQHKKLPNPQSEAAKEWQGWGTALKPAHEPICVARKPMSEKNVALNVLRWGTGGIDIDGSRIGTETRINKGMSRNKPIGAGTFRDDNWEPKDVENVAQGRWPANVLLECTCEEVIEGKSGKRIAGRTIRTPNKIYGGGKGTNVGDNAGYEVEDKAIIHTDPNCPCYMLDEQSGESGSSKRVNLIRKRKGFMLSGCEDNIQMANAPDQYGDTGGASRFFYCAKASPSERGKGNNHPTCKPIKLMEYLIKLVSREGATILDPFAGSGSTELACVALGRKCIGIEQSEEYCEMARDRCRQMVLT